MYPNLDESDPARSSDWVRDHLRSSGLAHQWLRVSTAAAMHGRVVTTVINRSGGEAPWRDAYADRLTGVLAALPGAVARLHRVQDCVTVHWDGV